MALEQEVNRLLKKTYDKYLPEDWKSDSSDVGNLNPRREVSWDKPLDQQILERLQKITNNIIKSKIAPPPSPLKGSMSSGLPPKPDPIFTLTDDPDIQFLIGTVSAPINGLDLPPEIECDDILDALLGSDREKDEDDDAGKKDDSDDSDSGEYDDSGSGSGGSGGNDDENNTEDNEEDTDETTELDEEEEDDGAIADDDWFDDYEQPIEPEMDIGTQNVDDSMQQCALIEINWLKIILAIAKVIAMLRRIIDFVFGIILPIISIVQLAAGAWLNPVNIAKIAQLIMQAVIAIIIQLISGIIQMLWELLNADCIASVAESLIKEIQKALSAFSSVMSAFDPISVATVMEKFNKEIMSPLKNTMDDLKKRAEGWDKVIGEVKELVESPEARAKLTDAILNKSVDATVSAVQNDPHIKRTMKIVQDGKKQLEEISNIPQKMREYKEKQKKAMEEEGKKANSYAEKMLMDVAFVGMVIRDPGSNTEYQSLSESISEVPPDKATEPSKASQEIEKEMTNRSLNGIK